MLRPIIVCFALACVADARDPVRLRAYPQKFRESRLAVDYSPPPALSREAVMPPLGDVTTTAITSDGAVWIGTRSGLMRFDAKADPLDRWQYFGGRRYLDDDEVVGLVPSGTGVWVRTKTGTSHIRLEPMTLLRKAEYFHRRVVERHDRYGLVAGSRLREPGNLATNQLSPNDNDGLWTAMYAAAECFRYAVTRSGQALARARKSTEAVLFLEQVTGRPGFPARSYIRKGDFRGSDGVWHWTPDGAIEWKADTSSDEIVGHFYLFGVAWDLLPDQALKDRIAATARRIMDHILANGYHLTDINGQPTYWGRWSPEYFATPRGKPDSPLNALELLSFLKTTAHITGDARYDAEYRKVAFEMKYLEIMTHLDRLRTVINYSDEELAMLPFYLIFRYERDPQMLVTYRKALDQWWQNMRREKNPLWTFIYAVANPGRDADLAGAVWTLQRIPMDLINWTVRNSHRKDVVMAPSIDRFKRPQSETLLPADERPIMKWNSNPFVIDGGGNGNSEDDGAFFLLPYWMGRHHRLLLGE
ncbi:MAG: hypothetical protein ACRD8O_20670 [Bryobacteraceae bacterium]